MTNRKLDIFALFKKIDAGDHGFYEKLSPDEQKDFSPLIVQRWMSSGSELQLMMLNSITNRVIFALPKHRELVAKLLVTCSDRSHSRKTWLKMPGRGTKASSQAIAVLKAAYGYSTREAERQLPLLPASVIMELAERQGLQDDELKQLRKELSR